MKIKVIWIIFFSALSALLVFQATGLYHHYMLKKEGIERSTNDLFRASIEKEVSYRRVKAEQNGDTLVAQKAYTYTVNADSIYRKSNILVANEQELAEAGIYQQSIDFFGFPFEIQTLDSIFGEALKNEEIASRYALFYRDSIGEIIDKVEKMPESKMKKAFKTDNLLIINGNRVQAFVEITPPAIYKQMLELLISSFIALFVLLLCIVYETRTIITQHELDKRKNDFFHAFTHNLLTPLSTIKSVLSTFMDKQTVLSNEIKEQFANLGIVQVDNLQMALEQILALAQLEKGNLKLKLSDTNMVELIDELKAKFTISKKKQVTITTSVEIDKGFHIYVDKTLVKDAVSNLIDNAVKYSGDSVQIIIDCFTEYNKLIIRVKDNGYGISAKDQLTIFEKFERGVAVERKEAKGFGLGLNFVKSVAVLHGGAISLSSQEGKGSAFTISIPMRDAKNLTIN
jgi:two-component system phosphate regulon sensor histidine kinase PhoR